MTAIIILIVMLFPAAFFGGMLQVAIARRARNLRTPISVILYIVLVLFAFMMIG